MDGASKRSAARRRRGKGGASISVSAKGGNYSTAEVATGSNGKASSAKGKPPSRRTSSSDGDSKYKITWPVIIALVSLGLIFQAILAGRVLKEHGVTDRESFQRFLESTVLPQVETGLSMINGSLRSVTAVEEKNRPGKRLAEEGAQAKYPVIMVPGFVTSGLELWAGEECAQKHFRTRLWGSMSMAQTFFSDRECWRRHLSLDPKTGMDPGKVRLRVAQGFEAADYFMATYWVWDKLITNLADVGYDGSNMVMMSYDWRLAFPKLEERDGYFTRLKHTIEAYHETSGEKTVVASHSMGTSVVLYFFAWVTTDRKDGGGGGGKNWVEEHVHAFINVAGPLLGVPKSVPALMSGELKDTAVLLGAMGSMLETYFGRKVRKDMFNTWGALWSMIPKGGDAIWGVGADLCEQGEEVDGLSCKCVHSCDDSEDPDGQNGPAEGDKSKSNMILMPNRGCFGEQEEKVPDDIFPDNEEKTEAETRSAQTCPVDRVEEMVMKLESNARWSTEEMVEFLETYGGGYGSDLSAAQLHSFESEPAGRLSSEHWHNPTVTPLPAAPNVKLYCFYGHGIPTERGYYYKKHCGQNATAGGNDQECSATLEDPPIILDTSVKDEDNNITYGVRLTSGDVSVPLVSLGYMCVDGWKGRSRLNPSGMEVVTREYRHEFEFAASDPIRMGPRSGEHCDILGNVDMMEDFLSVVTDHKATSVKTRLSSNIEEIAERINSHPLGGLKAAKGETRPLFGFGKKK